MESKRKIVKWSVVSTFYDICIRLDNYLYYYDLISDRFAIVLKEDPSKIEFFVSLGIKDTRPGWDDEWFGFRKDESQKEIDGMIIDCHKIFYEIVEQYMQTPFIKQYENKLYTVESIKNYTPLDYIWLFDKIDDADDYDAFESKILKQKIQEWAKSNGFLFVDDEETEE